MKKLFLIILISIFALSNTISWQSSLKKATNLAKKENKNILVFVSSSHCPYCQRMEEEIFEDKQGVKYLSKKYIFVKMDISKAKEFFKDVYVTPTTYIITPNKELLASQIGYQNEEFFYYTVGNADRKLQELQNKKGKK